MDRLRRAWAAWWTRRRAQAQASGRGGDADPDAVASREAFQAALDRLEAENRRLQADMLARDAFLAGLSHELRSPLNAVIGFAELLRSGAVPPGSPKGAEYLGHIEGRGRDLLQLINDVVTLARTDVGQLTFAPQAAALRTLVDQTLDLVHTPLLRRRLAVTVDIGDDVSDVVLDPCRFKQMLFPCLAFVATAAEAGTVTIRARGEAAVALRVQVIWRTGPSNGVHRPLAPVVGPEAPHGAHVGDSVGMGLARRIARAQGGHLDRVDIGDGVSAFLLRVPLAAAPVPEPPGPAVHALTGEADRGGPGPGGSHG